MKIYYVIFCLIIFSLLGVQCQNSSQKKGNTYNNSEELLTELHENPVERLKAIQKCASCHKDEYKNWLIGPHANAYKSLVEYLPHMDSSGNFPDGWKKYVHIEFSTGCVSCHTGQNLYETVFKGLDAETNEGHFSDAFYPYIFRIKPLTRNGEFATLNTGVDCLTCHKSGNKIVTNGSYIKNNVNTNKNNCDLLPSKFFSTNLSCINCHHHQVNSMNKLITDGKMKNEINCNNCHMEYNEKGKSTHYYYWKHDAPEKKRPKKLNMYSDINVKIKSTNNRQILYFHWGNNYIPHAFSECGESAAFIEIRDKDNKLILEFKEYVNRKEYMTTTYKENKYLKVGELGNDLNFNEKPIEKTYTIKGDLTGGRIIIRGMEKSQYWCSSKELKEKFKKEIPIN